MLAGLVADSLESVSTQRCPEGAPPHCDCLRRLSQVWGVFRIAGHFRANESRAWAAELRDALEPVSGECKPLAMSIGVTLLRSFQGSATMQQSLAEALAAMQDRGGEWGADAPPFSGTRVARSLNRARRRG